MHNNTLLSVDEIMKNIEDELNDNHHSRYDDILKYASKDFKVKNIYTIDEFTKYLDEEFIENAFYGVLRRAPDEKGKELYLSLLRSGILSKTIILANLRYSDEGIAQNVNILGIKKYKYIKTLFNRPIIKSVFVVLLSITKLFSLSKTLSQYERYLYEKSQDDKFLEEHIRKLKVLNSSMFKEIQTLSRTNQYMTNVQTTLTKIIDLISKNDIEEIKPTIIQELKTEQKNMLDLMYIAFEDKFRGSKNEIKERLKIYLPYIKDIKNDSYVLDVGCGRGEWLELLRENNIKAKGLDLNTPMIEQAHTLGLDVINEDVISYLKKLPDNSINAMTGFHIVEHLPFEVMMSMFQESLRVLKTTGLVIFETPNPENILVGAHYFYNDPTHKNPLVPVTLEFILEYIGFESVEIKRLHTYADAASLEASEDAFLNNNFYNAMDFAVIGHKR